MGDDLHPKIGGMTMLRTIMTTACCLVALPTTALANEAPLRAALEVDATQAGAGHDVIERRIVERGAVVLRDAGILPAQSADDPSIHVAIAELDAEEPGYRYSVTIPGVDDWSGEGTCQLCTEGELVQAVEAALAQAPEHLPRQQQPPPPTPTTRPSPSTADRAPLGTLGKTGIGLLAGGVLLTGVGIGLAAAPPRVDPDAPLEKTTTRPPGYALVGVGAATLITGAILLSLDRTKAKRAAVAPTLGPTTAGVVLSGRF
jgi:hypothetical protein